MAKSLAIYGRRLPRLPSPRRLRFRPVTTANPSPGSYDPQIDAQVRAANRGFVDLGQDIEKANERGVTDLGLARQQVGTQRDRTLRNLNIGLNRFNQDAGIARSDLQTSLQNSLADIQRRRADISRSYGQLAQRQGDAIAARGVGDGGTAAAAAQARAGNEGWAQSALDTAQQRTQAQGWRALVGQAIREQRYRDDNRLQRVQLATDTSRSFGKLDLQAQRSRQDRRQQLSRAGRENRLFGIDASQSRWYQAAGAGAKQPSIPGYERTSPNGTVYRVLDTKQGRFYVTPNGRPSRRRPR